MNLNRLILFVLGIGMFCATLYFLMLDISFFITTPIMIAGIIIFTAALHYEEEKEDE